MRTLPKPDPATSIPNLHSHQPGQVAHGRVTWSRPPGVHGSLSLYSRDGCLETQLLAHACSGSGHRWSRSQAPCPPLMGNWPCSPPEALFSLLHQAPASREGFSETAGLSLPARAPRILCTWLSPVWRGAQCDWYVILCSGQCGLLGHCISSVQAELTHSKVPMSICWVMLNETLTFLSY